MKPFMIGVTGLAQHGKDTVAERLIAGYGYSRLSIADGVRDLAEAVDPHVKAVVKDMGWDRAKSFPEYREFLVRLGHGCREVLGDKVWINKLEDAWDDKDYEFIVVPDIRYMNEALWAVDEGILLRVTRPNFDNGVDPTYPSEIEVPNLPADYDLVNDGTIEDLWVQVDKAMENECGSFVELYA